MQNYLSNLVNQIISSFHISMIPLLIVFCVRRIKLINKNYRNDIKKIDDSQADEEMKIHYKNSKKRRSSEDKKSIYLLGCSAIFITFFIGLQPILSTVGLNIRPVSEARWNDVTESIITLGWGLILLFMAYNPTYINTKRSIYLFQKLSYLYLFNSGLNFGYGLSKEAIVDLILFVFILVLTHKLNQIIYMSDEGFKKASKKASEDYN